MIHWSYSVPVRTGPKPPVFAGLTAAGLVQAAATFARLRNGGFRDVKCRQLELEIEQQLNYGRD